MSAAYESALWGTATYIDNTLLPQERAKLNAWETAARAAGVYEGTIIVAVLQPWNAWDQGMADLSGIAIPNELKRVQAGGADGDLSAFKWTFPPPLPDIATLLEQQGGALVGAQQHTAALSPVPPPEPVNLPPAVLADPSPALASVVNNMAPESRPGAVAGGAALSPTGMTGVLGDAPQSGALGASGNSGEPALGGGAGPADPLPASPLPGWLWPLAALAAFVLFTKRD